MDLLKDELILATQNSEIFTSNYYQICNVLVLFYEKYPLYFDSMLEEISINETDFEKFPILKEIYQVGEEINYTICTFIEKGINQRFIRTDIKKLPTAFTIWGSLCGVISLAYKKEPYILQGMNMNKNDFLKYSFELLFQSICREVL